MTQGLFVEQCKPGVESQNALHRRGRKGKHIDDLNNVKEKHRNELSMKIRSIFPFLNSLRTVLLWVGKHFRIVFLLNGGEVYEERSKTSIYVAFE
jgi:hypothetical protein